MILLRVHHPRASVPGGIWRVAGGLATAGQGRALGRLVAQTRAVDDVVDNVDSDPERVNARRLRGNGVHPDKADSVGSGQCSGRMGPLNGTSDQNLGPTVRTESL
jgi:hypothetical protein